MTKRIYGILAVALLAIAPILGACSGSGLTDPPIVTDPLPPPPPPPASRNAILGRGQGTTFPDCIPHPPGPDRGSDLSIGYDAMEPASFVLVFKAENGYVFGPLYVDYGPKTNASQGAGQTKSYKVWAPLPLSYVVTRVEIQMFSADGTRVLNADPNPRVFNHLDIPFGPQFTLADCP